QIIAMSDYWSRRTLAELAAAHGRAAFVAARALMAREGEAAGVAAMRSFLAAHEGSAYEAPARLALARALLVLARYDEALAETSHLLQTAQEAWAHARALHARALFAVGDRAGAVRYLR